MIIKTHNKQLLWCVLILTLFISCKSKLNIIQYDHQKVVIDTTIQKNATVDSFLQTYRTKKDEVMNSIIGYTTTPLSKTQPESSLGNFMCDAQLSYAKTVDSNTVAAVINYGSIRIPYISPGAITNGTIYELMPFDNILSIVEVPGKVIQVFCDHMAALGGWPTSNLTYEIKDKKAINILINNKPIHDNIIYKLALSDYIANGGDNCIFLKECKRKEYNIFLRDVLIQYLKDNESIAPTIERRVYYGE